LLTQIAVRQRPSERRTHRIERFSEGSFTESWNDGSSGATSGNSNQFVASSALPSTFLKRWFQNPFSGVGRNHCADNLVQYFDAIILWNPIVGCHSSPFIIGPCLEKLDGGNYKIRLMPTAVYSDPYPTAPSLRAACGAAIQRPGEPCWRPWIAAALRASQ